MRRAHQHDLRIVRQCAQEVEGLVTRVVEARAAPLAGLHAGGGVEHEDVSAAELAPIAGAHIRARQAENQTGEQQHL